MALESASSGVMAEAVNDCLDEGLQHGERLTLQVQGDCMEPVLLDQQQVQVCQRASYLPGDIVAYYCPYHQKRLVHRVVGRIPIYANDGEQRYLIMADNAVKPDVLVPAQMILGKVDIEIRLPKRIACYFKGLYWFAMIAGKKVLARKK